MKPCRPVVLLLPLSAACAAAPTPPPVAPEPPPVQAPPAPVASVEAPAPAAPSPPPPPPEAPAPDPLASADIADAPPKELEAAATHVKKGDWRRARSEVQGTLKGLGANASLDIVLVGHALSGRACAMLKDSKCAEAEYGAVSGAWDAGAVKRLASLGGDEAAQRRRLSRALAAVGEAVFFAAEQKRREADKLARPVYRGSGVREDVLKFVNTKIKDWVTAKRPAIEGVEKAYAKVVEIQPVPPPRWVIASAERVGAMWSGFVDEFRDTPVPKEWRGDGPVPGADGLTYKELREEYRGKIDEASAPQLEVARGAYRTCSEHAAKYRITDDRSRACDAWLAAHPKP